MQRWKKYCSAFLLMLCASGSVAAHEFWIEGTVADRTGQTNVTLDLKVGQHMAGQSLPFIPDYVVQFQALNGGAEAILGQTGSIPAARVAFDPTKGFAGFIEMAPRTVTHSDWGKFLQYLDTEGLNRVEVEHLARRLPQSGFTETYARHAKLVIFGTEKSYPIPEHHTPAPIDIEILATQEISMAEAALQGRLVIGGDLAPNRQVSVFVRNDGHVQSFRILTDENGAFHIEFRKGATLLFNSVEMTEGGSPEIAWHSDWASLFVVTGTN